MKFVSILLQIHNSNCFLVFLLEEERKRRKKGGEGYESSEGGVHTEKDSSEKLSCFEERD